MFTIAFDPIIEKTCVSPKFSVWEKSTIVWDTLIITQSFINWDFFSNFKYVEHDRVSEFLKWFMALLWFYRGFNPVSYNGLLEKIVFSSIYSKKILHCLFQSK